MNPITIGLASTIVTELLKFVPFLRKNSITKSLTAIIVIFGVTYISGGQFTFDSITGSFVVALTAYVAVLQPIASTMGLSTQS